MSVSAFAYGTTAAAGSGLGTLALNTLISIGIDFSAPYDAMSGIRVLTDGTVEEYVHSTTSWVAQASGTEWIDAFDAETASAYEVMYETTTGGTTPAGEAIDTWITIDGTKSWTLSVSTETSLVFIGNLKIRQKTIPSNAVTASATIDVSGGL